jgi:hypothetical protein
MDLLPFLQSVAEYNPLIGASPASHETSQPPHTVSNMNLKPIFALFIVIILIASALTSVGLFLFQMGVFG